MPEKNKPNNRLLAALPAKEYQRMLPKLEEFSLNYGELIYKTGDPVDCVYFPESGIISLLSAVEKHSLLEVGIVGNEGFVGLPVFLGAKKSNQQAVVQGKGFALKMKTADFTAECKSGGKLPQILQRYVFSLMTQISQSAACNRFHAVERRLARWLLMTRDRTVSDEFRITQEFLSNMLGVRREAINKTATALQRKELISYSRGQITILDRAGLEDTACRCYFIIKEEYENFLA